MITPCVRKELTRRIRRNDRDVLSDGFPIRVIIACRYEVAVCSQGRDGMVAGTFHLVFKVMCQILSTGKMPQSTLDK